MSILNVNQIQPVGSGQTVTISAANITASSSTITANTFSGSLSSSGVSTFSDTVNVGAGKSIRLYGASSGYSDIIAAAGSASTTFTLPANGGSNGQYLQTNGSGALSWAGAGKILQVVQGTSVTQATSTISSWAATSLAVSITPSGSSNKIAVFVSGGMNGFAGGGTSEEKMGMKIYRSIGGGGAAEVENSSSGQQVIRGANGDYSGLSINYLDSPSTTSSITYTLYFRREAGSGTASINRDSNNQTQIIAMEVAA
jgi:hypothetical protein